jgi:hypothetical protein
MSGGLIGALSRLKSGFTAKTSTIKPDLFGSIKRAFICFAICGAALAVVESVNAKSLSGIGYYKMLILGFAAITAEIIGLHQVVVGWHAAKFGKTVANAALFACAFSFATVNTFDTSAENQAKRANLHKTTLLTFTDARDARDNARARVKAEEASLATLKSMTWQAMPVVDGKPVMSADAARALIKGYEGQTRFFVDLTNRCTDAKGPQMRTFCGNHTAALAAEKDLIERAAWAKKIEAAETQLATARAELDKTQATASNTDTVANADVGFVHLASTVTSLNAEHARLLQSAQVPLTVMLLASLAGLILALEGIGDKPRTKWFGKWFGLHSIVFGAPSADQLMRDKLNRDGKVEMTVTDETGVNDLKSRIAAALNPKMA